MAHLNPELINQRVVDGGVRCACAMSTCGGVRASIMKVSISPEVQFHPYIRNGNRAQRLWTRTAGQQYGDGENDQ
jgi:hypothetical protein